MTFGRWILDSGFWFLEFRSRFPHSPKSLDFGLWTLAFGLWTLCSGFWALDFGLWVLDLRFWTLNIAFWTLDVGLWTFWALDLRFWTLDFWSLDSTFGSTLDSELEALDLGF
mgnify:CR=1 FL=1